MKRITSGWPTIHSGWVRAARRLCRGAPTSSRYCPHVTRWLFCNKEAIVLRTKLCELLQIDAPILLAPMGPEIAGLELAAAVSNAGGLGMISFGGYPPAALRDRIRRLRELTSQPFAVNVLLDGPHLPF